MNTKKKHLHQTWNTFSRIQVDTYAQMHTKVKLWGGNADVDHTQTIGGIYPPRVSAPLLAGLIVHSMCESLSKDRKP